MARTGDLQRRIRLFHLTLAKAVVHNLWCQNKSHVDQRFKWNKTIQVLKGRIGKLTHNFGVGSFSKQDGKCLLAAGTTVLSTPCSRIILCNFTVRGYYFHFIFEGAADTVF